MTSDVNLRGKIQAGVDLRKSPNVSAEIMGTTIEEYEIDIIAISELWYKFKYVHLPEPVWVQSVYVELISNTTDENGNVENNMVYVEKGVQIAATTAQETKKLIEFENSILAEGNSYMLEMNNFTDQQFKNGLIINNLNGIYGIPYQFMASVDARIGGSTGRKYAEKIISKMPLLCITPGRCEFLSNFSKREKKGLLARLLDIDDAETKITDIIKKNGKYYTFAFSYSEYFEYVNALCRAGSRFLGIEDTQLNIGGNKAAAKNFDWGKALNSDLKSTFSSQEFIGFYLDSQDSINESFGNDTVKSQLAESINGMSALANEAEFLLGHGAGAQVQLLDDAQLKATTETINDISSKYFNNNHVIKNLMNGFATIASGGKLLFPEIWSDSTFSRDVDVNIKLRSPDGDTLSWYLNIYVPLCHLIGLVAGHQTESANGYKSPFLIRAFCKGLFNIDMGIATGMSVTKGKNAAWNIDGLPTEVDVSLDIKDLYGMLSIVPNSDPKLFVTNDLLMNYIANTCGININEMDIGRSLEIYLILTKDRFTDLPSNIFRRFQDNIDTLAMDLFNASLKKFLI